MFATGEFAVARPPLTVGPSRDTRHPDLLVNWISCNQCVGGV
jgi:hypothetical protein